jgi:hypothetical protein
VVSTTQILPESISDMFSMRVRFEKARKQFSNYFLKSFEEHTHAYENKITVKIYVYAKYYMYITVKIYINSYVTSSDVWRHLLGARFNEDTFYELVVHQ